MYFDEICRYFKLVSVYVYSQRTYCSVHMAFSMHLLWLRSKPYRRVWIESAEARNELERQKTLLSKTHNRTRTVNRIRKLIVTTNNYFYWK